MSEHTPEPWNLPGTPIPMIYGPKAERVCRIIDNEADARRIIACVNACAGVPLAALEKAAECAGVGKFGTMAAMYKAQRDESVEALKKIKYALENLGGGLPNNDFLEPYFAVKRAIEKVEGKTE